MPHFTGKPPESINITGYLFPWYLETDQPVILRSHPTDKNPGIILPIFSTEEKLYDAIREWLKPDGPWKIKMIQEGLEFLSSFTGVSIIVAADPYITADGNTRFTAVMPQGNVN